MSLQKEKVLQAKKIVGEEGVDVWITIGKESTMNSEPILPLLSTVQFGGLTAILITPTTSYCVCGHLEAAAFETANIFDEVSVYDKDFKDVFLPLLSRLAPRTVALNYSLSDVASDGLTHGLFLKMQSYLEVLKDPVQLVSSEKIIGKIKGRKTPDELTRITKACKVTEKILFELKDFIRVGMTDMDIFHFCHQKIEEYKVDFAWEKEHNPGVFVGPNGRIGHKGPDGIKVEPGFLINLDFGVKVEEYCSDIQRTYYVPKAGETTTPKHLVDGLAIIHQAIQEGMNLMRPGISGFVPDSKAREVLKKHGFPEFNFGFGHQVGRSTHDGGVMMGPQWPRYQGIVEGPLEESMVLTVDVNLAFPEGRIGQEDCVYIGESGTQYISQKQTDIYLCRGGDEHD